MRTRSSTSSVRCRKDARETAYARGAPSARLITALMTARATSGVASDIAFDVAQNFGTSRTAATISRASLSGSLTPSDSSMDAHPASKSPMVPIGIFVGKNGAPDLFTELLLDVGNLERFNERLDLAIQHFRQLVQREIDAVIGDSILRIVVRADLCRAIARADLSLAHAGACGLLLGD